MTTPKQPSNTIGGHIHVRKKIIYPSITLSIITFTFVSIYTRERMEWPAVNIWTTVFYISTSTITTMQLLQHRKSLLLAITFRVLLSVGCYTTLSWIWGGRFLAGWTSEQSLNFKELLSSTLTAVGGIGAFGYLVIKYREQASAEREELHQN